MMISTILRANLGMSTGAGSLLASMQAACARASVSAALSGSGKPQPPAHPVPVLAELGAELLPAALRAELRLVPLLADKTKLAAAKCASIVIHGEHSNRERPYDCNLRLERGGVRPLADYIFAMNRNKRSAMDVRVWMPPFLKWKMTLRRSVSRSSCRAAFAEQRISNH
jgi:hypothetical protein